MNQKNWQRARSSEQREIRTREILGAAEKLFISRPYEKITMQMIAREASLSQSNLYRYFTTREEIFLKIFLTDLENLTNQVETEFTREITADEFVSRLTDLLMKQERFLHLSPLLAVTLEKNSSEEVYRSVKLAIAELTGRIGAAVNKALPALSPEQISGFIFFQQALIAGARPMTVFNDMQLKILDELKMPELHHDFSAFFSETLGVYLKGLLS